MVPFPRKATIPVERWRKMARRKAKAQTSDERKIFRHWVEIRTLSDGSIRLHHHPPIPAHADPVTSEELARSGICEDLGVPLNTVTTINLGRHPVQVRLRLCSSSARGLPMRLIVYSHCALMSFRPIDLAGRGAILYLRDAGQSKRSRSQTTRPFAPQQAITD